jgi:hypothetical protein
VRAQAEVEASLKALKMEEASWLARRETMLGRERVLEERERLIEVSN